MSRPGDDDNIRLPRGKGFRLRSTDAVRIGMFATLLVLILVLGRPCADGVAGFVDSFSPPPDAAPAAPPPESGMQLQRLTEEEIRKRFPGGTDAGAGPGTEPGSEPDPDPVSDPDPRSR
jgi:hypothetical protein